MPSSSPPPAPRDDGYVAMVPTPVKENQRPFDSIPPAAETIGTPTVPRQELRHRHHGASFSTSHDNRFEGIGSDDRDHAQNNHHHNQQKAGRKERKLTTTDTSSFSLDALFGGPSTARATALEDEADEKTLDAPLLANEQGDQQGQDAAAATGATRRRRNSEITQGGDAAAGREEAAPPSRSEEILDRVKETSWSVACDVLDLIPNKVAGKLFVPPIKESIRHQLHDFQEAMLVPFSHDEVSHQSLIRVLWDAVSSVRPPLPFAGDMDRETWRSELWKDYGFQGLDPGTDFRGAGLLGLRCVIWMAREEPELSRAMLDSGYFFAIAVINVVMALMNILHLTKGKRTCLETTQPNLNFTSQEARYRLSNILGGWRNTPSSWLPPPPPGPPGSGTDADDVAKMEDALFTMTAEACRVLQGEWLRGKRNVMEFNHILKAAKIRFETLLRDKETHPRVSRAIDKRYPEVPLSCSGI